MKIYLLPVHPKLQPRSQPFRYPHRNPDYGVEQDFLTYVSAKRLSCDHPCAADWHYLPVFWTRWHLNHDYGSHGLEELHIEISKSLIDTSKTFTICQYDDGPLIDLGRTTVFLSSRKDHKGIDIPLLRNRLRAPLWKRRKKYLASFVGRLSTHRIRQEMADALSDNSEICISDGDKGQRYFTRMTTTSYLALCPRGYGGNSFRFYEAMQLGVVPLLIGERDTRPFKKLIEWNDISFFADTMEKVQKIITNYDKERLLSMGVRAQTVYLSCLQYGRWGDYVIEELKSLASGNGVQRLKVMDACVMNHEEP